MMCLQITRDVCFLRCWCLCDYLFDGSKYLSCAILKATPHVIPDGWLDAIPEVDSSVQLQGSGIFPIKRQGLYNTWRRASAYKWADLSCDISFYIICWHTRRTSNPRSAQGAGAHPSPVPEIMRSLGFELTTLRTQKCESSKAAHYTTAPTRLYQR